jgi:hypothetical protein
MQMLALAKLAVNSPSTRFLKNMAGTTFAMFYSEEVHQPCSQLIQLPEFIQVGVRPEFITIMAFETFVFIVVIRICIEM